MTFDEAMKKSRELECEAWIALLLKKPKAERDAARSAYIQFNPYVYQESGDAKRF